MSMLHYQNEFHQNISKNDPLHNPYTFCDEVLKANPAPPPLTYATTVTSPFGYEKQSNRVLLSHPSVATSLFATRVAVKKVMMLYNPLSGKKRGEKVMRVANEEFVGRGIEVDIVPTEYRAHATEICESYNFDKYDVLCVIGGDGTFHECINGIMRRMEATKKATFSDSKIGFKIPVLGLLAAGTGNSLVLELEGAKHIRHSISAIIYGTTIPIDIMKVTVLSASTSPPYSLPTSSFTSQGMLTNNLTNNPTNNLTNNRKLTRTSSFTSQGVLNYVSKHNISHPLRKSMGSAEDEEVKEMAGDPQVSRGIDEGQLNLEVIYAFNSLHWGLGSKVIATAERLRWMGSAIRYTSAALYELTRSSLIRAKVVVEDACGNTEEITGYFSLIIANNIGGAGKGMKMAPKAKINDGLIDLLLFKSDRVIDLLKVFKKLYKGTHIDLPFVEYRQVSKFAVTPYKPSGQIQADDNPEVAEEVIDIDGELKGCTPFVCEVLPNALQIII